MKKGRREGTCPVVSRLCPPSENTTRTFFFCFFLSFSSMVHAFIQLPIAAVLWLFFPPVAAFHIGPGVAHPRCLYFECGVTSVHVCLSEHDNVLAMVEYGAVQPPMAVRTRPRLQGL